MRELWFRAEWEMDGRPWRFDRVFTDRMLTERRSLAFLRKQFDREFSYNLVAKGILYRVERMRPRQASWTPEGTPPFFQDDGVWLEETIFPKTPMEQLAEGLAESLANAARENARRGDGKEEQEEAGAAGRGE